jgi:O-antigen ligase
MSGKAPRETNVAASEGKSSPLAHVDARRAIGPSARPSGAGLARGLSFLAFLLAALCYWSLFRHANFYVLLAQALVWGLAFWNRRWPLYALTLAFPFFGNQPGAPYALYLVDMTLWLVVGRWLWRRWRLGAPPFVYTPLNPWLVLGWLVAAASLLPHLGEQYAHARYAHTKWPGFITPAIFSAYRTLAFDVMWPLHAFLDLTLSLLLFFYLVDEWRGRRVRWRLLRNLWIGMGASMLLGLLDFFHVLPLNWFRPENPEILKFGYERLQSLFWHSGWYSQWIALLAPMGLAFCLGPGMKARRGASSETRVLRAGGLALCAVAGWVMLLTLQRGGVLALAAGYGTVGVLAALGLLRTEGGRRQAAQLFGAVGAVAILVALVLGVLAYRGDTALGRRVREFGMIRHRSAIWHSAWTLSMRHPVLGVGMGYYYMAHSDEFREGHPFYSVDKGEAHNTYLHFLAERGPFALIFFLAALGAAISSLARTWRKSACSPRRAPWIVGGAGMLAAWMVYGCVQYMFYVRIVDLTFWILMAFVLLETPYIAPLRTPQFDAAVRAADKHRRRALGALIHRMVRSEVPATADETCGEVSAAGGWWLLGPFAMPLALALALGPLIGPRVEALARVTGIDFGPFTYALFLVSGYAPWLVMAGALADAWRRPSMTLGQLAFTTGFRLEIFAVWLLFFLGGLAFLLDRTVAVGAGLFLLLGLMVLLTVNLSLLAGRFLRLLSLDRRLPTAILWPALAAWFCATPVVYPYWSLPEWAQTAMLLNPLLASVRISQSILFGQTAPSWRLWLAIVGWSGFFTVLSGLAGAGSIIKRRRSTLAGKPGR